LAGEPWRGERKKKFSTLSLDGILSPQKHDTSTIELKGTATIEMLNENLKCYFVQKDLDRWSIL
jgi:hypothetical protein